MLQVSNVTEKEALLAFQEGLKPWVKQEVEQRGVQKLSEAMTVAESVVKLGLGKDKLGSSKSKEKGVCEGNHKEDNKDGNYNGNNGGNRKPRKCPKKSALKKKPCPRKPVIDGNDGADKEPKKLGSSKGKTEAKRAKRSKSIIEGNDGADKEPKKLDSSKGKSEAKREKRSKKKRQVVVQGKATSEHDESLEGLLPKEEVSLSSNLEEEVAMKTVKLGLMRLKSSKASELAKSSTRLPPMGEVGNASDFKEKEVIHVGQLTRVNAKVHSKHFDSVLHSNLLTWQEHRGPFEVLEQGGRETVGKAKPSVVNHEDSVRGELECGQGSDITPCRRDVQTSRTAQVKKQRKPRQKSRRKRKAKASIRDRGESS
ncbi:hypothetical protein F383_33526 [Gossypium arboreum]|uniref:Uncharacterized protein n=1 Tax=Gossypium arboreum TaxID=29729 RepID=A0A0B0N254_GOSAR|nr:hypothetical protein F383_33526 [Gossypium arboreum]